MLTTANRVKSYSVIGRDDVSFFKLPHYKGISMEKELYYGQGFKNHYAENLFIIMVILIRLVFKGELTILA